MGKKQRSVQHNGRTTTRKPADPVGVLIHSNAPWANTGYGVQTGALAKACQQAGRTVTLSVNYGLQGGISGWEGIEVLPTGFHPYSADILGAHTRYTEETTGQPTALITLFDCWVYKGRDNSTIPLIASWVPIDHLPAPADVIDWCQQPNVLPIAMSKFGLDMLNKAGIESFYAPHGVDTSVFNPDATIDGTPGRSALGIPDDAFVVGMVAANKGTAPIRKAFGENLLAMGQFMAEHDDVWLYMHTEKRGAQGGIDLIRLMDACGIPTNRTVWVDQWGYYAGLSSDVVAALMASMDVHLLASRGEGFGVPVLEAAACGVPSIVSNFTAQPELVDGSGWLTAVQPYWDAAQATWFATPLVHSIVENLNDAYEHANDTDRREAARAHAETYDHAIVFDKYWQPILSHIDELMAK